MRISHHIISNMIAMKTDYEFTSQVEKNIQQEFTFSETRHIEGKTLSQEQLEAIVVVSNVLFVRINQMATVVDSQGKRAAAKIFRLYRQVIQRFAELTQAHFEIYDSCSFLLIYPGPHEEAPKAVKRAMQLTHILTDSLKAYAEQFNKMDFAIGIDHGRILGTNEGRLIWQGICIEKAKKISEMCLKPYRIGISGMVYKTLDETDKVVTKRILGMIPKKEEIWQRNSYDFSNEHRHYFVTKHTEPYQPQENID